MFSLKGILWIKGKANQSPDSNLIADIDIEHGTQKEVCDTVRNTVKSVIENTPNDSIRYLIIELFIKELWVRWKPSLKYWDQSIETWVYLESSKNIADIIISIASREEIQIDRYENLKIWNIFLKLSVNISWEIIIWFDSKKINVKDVEKLKTILQKYVISNCILDDTSINWEKVIDILSIQRDNIIHCESNKLVIAFPDKWDISLDKDVLSQLVLNIKSFGSDYYVKPWKIYWFENAVSMEIASGGNPKEKYNLIISTVDNSLVLEIQNINHKIQEKFLSNFLKAIIHQLNNIQNSGDRTITNLEKLWVQVILPSPIKCMLDDLYISEWFVWYEDIKEEIDTKVIKPWLNKQQYQELTAMYFPHIKSMIPNYIIFEWGPGTWKTTQGRIIWKYLDFPYIYIPINSITSKWYGESEQRLNDIFELSWKIAKEHGWAVLMIDEIDEIGANRDESHEATGRVTWVLLKKLDGIEKIENILLIASTNRLNKLDPALVNRSHLTLHFRNPNTEEINAIIAHYIPNIWQLSNEIKEILTWNSGRMISNLCKDFISYLLKTFPDEDFQSTEFLQSSFEDFLDINIKK